MMQLAMPHFNALEAVGLLIGFVAGVYCALARWGRK